MLPLHFRAECLPELQPRWRAVEWSGWSEGDSSALDVQRTAWEGGCLFPIKILRIKKRTQVKIRTKCDVNKETQRNREIKYTSIKPWLPFQSI